MNSLLKDLRQEHQVILDLIAKKQIFPLLDFVENVHHPREENLLFPTLARHPLLRQGGPRCMYFMGLNLDLKVLDPARNILKELKNNGCPPSTQYQDFEWLQNGSPLRIPVEEHILGHELASAIRHLATLNTKDVLLERTYDEYCKLLKLHIEKEDTCLFVLAEKILTASSPQ